MKSFFSLCRFFLSSSISEIEARASTNAAKQFKINVRTTSKTHKNVAHVLKHKYYDLFVFRRFCFTFFSVLVTETKKKIMFTYQVYDTIIETSTLSINYDGGALHF